MSVRVQIRVKTNETTILCSIYIISMKEIALHFSQVRLITKYRENRLTAKDWADELSPLTDMIGCGGGAGNPALEASIG